MANTPEKYAKKHQTEVVERVFNTIPTLLGEKFKYVKVAADLKSATVKDALHLLEKAGIAHIVYHSSGQAVPLAASKNINRFKVYLFDIGLAQRLLKLDLSEWVLKPLEVRHLGAISEQFVAQEFIAYTSEELYYWHKEAAKSNAEIDFLFPKNGDIIPIEVKSGKMGSLKSMQSFLDSHPNTPNGVKISEQSFSKNCHLLSLPFYEIEHWIKKA